jgi:uncharacterized protein YaaQ
MGGQAGPFAQGLREADFRFTEINTRGGIIQEPTTSLLVGMNDQRKEEFLSLARQHCHAHLQYIPARLDASALQGQPLMIEALVGGSVLFAVEVERFIQL